MGAEDCEEMSFPKKMVCVIKFERDEMDDAVGVGKGRGGREGEDAGEARYHVKR